MLIREETERLEVESFHPNATFSIRSKGRARDEAKCPIRTVYQRDRDRIIHSKSFRRLKQKTQVFLAPKGDHYRTRLTHTLEVSQIARTIARALRLNEDLTEAISMGHDLGHTPFGHAGEIVLNKLNPKGFRHYIQSLRVVDVLEKKGEGLNLTYEVRDGILHHSKGLGEIMGENDCDLPSTLEGLVVRISDVVAYVNHDLDDALRSGMINIKNLPKDIITILGDTHSKRLNNLVNDIIGESKKRELETISISDRILSALYELRSFLILHVYDIDGTHKEFPKVKKIISDLYNHFLENQELLPRRINNGSKEEIHQDVCDYIAGMTDSYTLEIFKNHFIPEAWAVF